MSTGVRMFFLFLYALILIGMSIPTVMTLLPREASKPNRLGYMSYCAFAPYSTLSMIAITVLLVGLVYVAELAVRSG